MKALTVIVDCQFGSTGKGLIAGYLAMRDKPDTIVTAWAANAGHTYIDDAGRKYVHTMLANGVVSPGLRQILIGPGSVLDLDNLATEIALCRQHIEDHQARIYIHVNAAVIMPWHRAEEEGTLNGGLGGMTKIGSTKKGVGAAMIQRIRRDPDHMNTIGSAQVRLHPLFDFPFVKIVGPYEYALLLESGNMVQVEGAQGYSLSMYHGFYPYTTSRDVTTAQIMADCGIPAGMMNRMTVIGTMRTYPIRVANRYDKEGNQVGWSGPTYPDQGEISFEEIGQQQELTTVTKLPRRIFTFSEQQAREAIKQCSVDEVFLNFVNYCKVLADVERIMNQVHLAGSYVRYLGYGPKVTDIEDRLAPMKGRMP